MIILSHENLIWIDPSLFSPTTISSMTLAIRNMDTLWPVPGKSLAFAFTFPPFDSTQTKSPSLIPILFAVSGLISTQESHSPSNEDRRSPEEMAD